MSEESDAEKSHEATPHKRDEARKKGDIPRSADVNAATGLLALVFVLTVSGPAITQASGQVLQAMLAHAAFGVVPFAEMAKGLAAAIWPLFVVPALAVTLALVAQRAIVVTPDKLRPKLDRISPAKTFGQKFGRAGLFEFAKSLAKLIAFAVVLGTYLAAEAPAIITAANGGVAIVGVFGLGLLGRALVVAVVIAALDLIFQHAEHGRRLMMTRQEIMDEFKEQDGDPAIKHQRRQRGIDIAMNRMLADVPKADVVIVNPTHYAIALKWERGSGRAPVCVAKGADEIAARIRAAAMTAGVPLRSDPPVARALFATVDLGQEVPPEHYRAVAAAIRFAERMRAKAART